MAGKSLHLYRVKYFSSYSELNPDFQVNETEQGLEQGRKEKVKEEMMKNEGEEEEGEEEEKEEEDKKKEVEKRVRKVHAPIITDLEASLVNVAELKAALRHRRGEDSGSGDDDPGLPRSPPTSPTTLDVLTHGLKGSSRATQSSCSDGSLLSMGSSDNDEDSLGAGSHHSSKVSLLEGRHQVVGGEQEQEPQGVRLRRKGGIKIRKTNQRTSFVSDAIIVGRDPDAGEDLDHEPVVGAVRLSHQAALHKIAVRPRRTHGAPRARRATQIGGQISLPDVIEEANSRHSSGPRASAPQPAPPPAPPPAPATLADPEVFEDSSSSGPEQQGSPDPPPVEKKEEKRDEPLFQRLFGSTSKRAGRRHSRGSGDDSRENSVSPLRRGTEQRASRDKRRDSSGSRFPLIGSGGSKSRQEPSHPLPPSGRTREPSKERGGKDLPPASQQSPEERQDTSPPSALQANVRILPYEERGSSRPQGVRKAKSFREEQTPAQRDMMRRKVSPAQFTTEDQTAVPSKVSRLSASLESIDGDDSRRLAPRPSTIPTALELSVSPQRSSTESLTTTPLPGVFIRQTSRSRPQDRQQHPGPQEEASSGPFSLDSSIGITPRETEDPLRKAASVDHVSYTAEGLVPSLLHRDHHHHHHHHHHQGKEHSAREQHLKDQQQSKEHQYIKEQQQIREQQLIKEQQHMREQQHIKEQQHIREQQHIKEQLHMREQQHIKEQQHIREQQHIKEHQHIKEQQLIKEHSREVHIKEKHIREQLHIREQHIQAAGMTKAADTRLAATTTTAPVSTATTTTASPSSIVAAKSSILESRSESMRSEKRSEPAKPESRKSPGQPQLQIIHKEEQTPTPGTPPQEPGEGERDQPPPRRPLRREPSVKRLPSASCDTDSSPVPEFMRIQLNRVESKGQSVIYDTEQEKSERRGEEATRSQRETAVTPLTSSEVILKEVHIVEQPVDTYILQKKEVTTITSSTTATTVTTTTATSAARDAAGRTTTPVGKRGSMQSSRALFKDSSLNMVLVESGTSEPSTEGPTPEGTTERVQLRRPLVTPDRPTSTPVLPSATSTPPAHPREQPELFKVFARRSFKVKDSEKEQLEALSMEETSLEATSEVSEMMVSATRPPSTSPAPMPDLPQKPSINAISFNSKSVGNPALSFFPPPMTTPSEPSGGPLAAPRSSVPHTSPSNTSHTTTTSVTPPEGPSTAASHAQGTVFSKILSNRVSGAVEMTNGVESEGSISPVPTKSPTASQTKPSRTSRPSSSLMWPPRLLQETQQEDPPIPHQPQPPTATPQDSQQRRAGEGEEVKEIAQDEVEVEVSPLNISAARRRFMSASVGGKERTHNSLLAPLPATSPPAPSPSPSSPAPTPSPPAPTPSPPVPTPSPINSTPTTLGIASSILARAGGQITPPVNPSLTPSFTVTVRTQPPPPATAPDPSPTPSTASPSPSSDSGAGQHTAEDWRVLVRQRREGRLKQTKTPDSEEIIMETRPPVSRNSKVLEMASNFQKLQVA